MSITIKEIQELKDYLVGTYHAKRIKAQETDQKYVDDNFSIDYLPEGIDMLKTGKAYRMVSAPAEHIISNNPKVYREPSGKATEAAKRVASEVNRWVRLMLRQNPQPFVEHVKKLLGRGEGWIYFPHNSEYDPKDMNDLPVNIIIPDPMIVYVDPDGGEKNGIPGRLVVCFERVAANIKRHYPDWVWQKKGSQPWTKAIPYLMYWDNEYRYFEADGDPLLPVNDEEHGIQKNVYGFVPFVHCYSGFGEGSPDGDPESLAVSRIRKIRDKIAEYTAIKSLLNNVIFKYGVPPIDLMFDPAIGVPSGNIGTTYDRSFGAFNVIGMPTGATMTKGVDKLPDAQVFEYLRTIENEISQEDPLGEVGQVMGSSGRQQLGAVEAGLRRYDTVVNNTANAFATVLGQALKMCEMDFLKIYPASLNENDIGGNYEVKLELKAEDPIANQIKSVDGDRKQQQGIIDHETNLIEYQGYTQEEAQNIIAKRMVDDVIMQDPVMRRLMAIQVAREAGLEEQYTALEAQLKGMETATLSSAPKIGSEGGEPREGNIQSPLGREMMDMSLSQRPTRVRPIA